MSKRAFLGALAAIVCVAFVLRLALRLRAGDERFWIDGYTFFFTIAQSLARDHVFAAEPGGAPTFFRVPLYPAFLALLTHGERLFIPVAVAQSLTGAATVGCAAFLARALFGAGAGLVAAGLTAVYPYYVVHDTALQETGLFTFLTCAATLVLVRAGQTRTATRGFGAGLLLGAAVMTRANLAPFALLAPFWLLLPQTAPRATSGRAWIAACCGLALLVATGPWLARSYALAGAPVLTSQSGFFLWLGNNPLTFSRYPRQSIDDSQKIALGALSGNDQRELSALDGDEAGRDDWFRRKGLRFIRDEPGTFVLGGLRKLAATFSWRLSPPGGALKDMVHAFSFYPVLILGLYGAWGTRRRWRLLLPLYAQIVTFCAVTFVYFGHTSYRAYIDVDFIILAAPVTAEIVHRIVERARGGPPEEGGFATEPRDVEPAADACRTHVTARTSD